MLAPIDHGMAEATSWASAITDVHRNNGDVDVHVCVCVSMCRSIYICIYMCERERVCVYIYIDACIYVEVCCFVYVSSYLLIYLGYHEITYLFIYSFIYNWNSRVLDPYPFGVQILGRKTCWKTPDACESHINIGYRPSQPYFGVLTRAEAAEASARSNAARRHPLVPLPNRGRPASQTGKKSPSCCPTCSLATCRSKTLHSVC